MENQQLSATSILSLFQTSKEERQSFVTSIVDDIKDGNKNPLEIHLQVKCMEDLIASLKDDPTYKESLLAETTKQLGGSKSVMFHNAKFEVKEVGTKYDFSQCTDPEYIKVAAEAEKAKKALKDREDFLKKAPSDGFEIVDKDSGEVVKIFPPSKTSTTAVVVTLK